MGSPYQTSLSEAGQDKFFYLVGRVDSDMTTVKGVSDRTAALTTGVQSTAAAAAEEAHNDVGTVWKEIERWTVSIGSKIIKVKPTLTFPLQQWHFLLDFLECVAHFVILLVHD